jgi:5'-nucleotidase
MPTATNDWDWSPAERIAAIICRAELTGALPPSLFLNVNVPGRDHERIPGILATRMGAHGYVSMLGTSEQSAVLERRLDIYTDPNAPPGTDLWALANGYVSVSPLQSNLTDHRLIDLLGQRLNAAFHA